MVVADALQPVPHAEAQKEGWVGPQLDTRGCPANKPSETTLWNTLECSASATELAVSE